MKIKSLLMAFIMVIIVGCVYTNTSFSISLLDSFNVEEDTEIIEFDLKKPEVSRLKQFLKGGQLVPWECSKIVHSCEGPAKCSNNGHVYYISLSFVYKMDIIDKSIILLMTIHPDNFVKIISTNALKNSIHIEKKAELLLLAETKEIVWFKIKKGNQWIEINLGKKTEI